MAARRRDPALLDGLQHIGVEELSYRRHHEYVTTVVDHVCQRVVWSEPGKNGDTLGKFLDVLGAEHGKAADRNHRHVRRIHRCGDHAGPARSPGTRWSSLWLPLQVSPGIGRAGPLVLSREVGDQLTPTLAIALEARAELRLFAGLPPFAAVADLAMGVQVAF